MTSSATSSWHLLKLKKAENATFDGFISNFWRTVSARITKFYALMITSLTNLRDMTPQAASGRQQNAVNYCTKKCFQLVQPAKSRIMQPLFNLESPNFTWASLLTCIRYDVISNLRSAFIEVPQTPRHLIRKLCRYSSPEKF